MSKRKFNLGDIVRKLNQESGDTSNPIQAPVPPVSHHPEAHDNVATTPNDSKNISSGEINSPFPKQPAIGNVQPEHSAPVSPAGTKYITEDNNHHNQHKYPFPKKVQSVPPEHYQDHTPSKVFPAPDTPVHSMTTSSLSHYNGNDNDNDNEEEETIDLFRYLSIIIRRRYVIVATILLSGLFSIYRFSTSDLFYVSRARLLFSPDAQNLTGDNSYFYYWGGNREKQFNTHLELLKSPSVLKMVSDNLGNSILPSGIGAGLTIAQGETNGEKNDIIELSFRHSDAEIARDVLNELCRTYIDYRRDVNSQEISRLLFKLETQIDKLQNELNIKESDLRRFKEDNQLIHLSSETNLTITKLSDMELALQKANLDLIELKERIISLNSQISKQDLDIVQSITYQDPLQKRLGELELELNTLSAEYSPEHFKVKTLKQQIGLLKAAAVDSISRVAASKTFVKNPIRQSLLQEYINLIIEKSALETKRVAQEQIMERLNHDLLKLPSLEQNYAFLQRETESQLQTLRLLKNKFEETKIKRDSQESDLKLLEMAETPPAAIRKVKATIVLIGILAGFFIGIAIAMIIEYLDQSLKDPLDVEKSLELPLLGIVPHIEADQDLFEQKDITKSILEPFRALRANLKHIATAHQLKTFIICSAVKGEGKTTLSANLSITYAMDGKRVILIDADLRRSQLHTLFSIPKKNGLAEYLLGTASIDEIIKPTKYSNLFLVTSGERPANPSELLGTWRFDKLIEELRERGDFIIFDSPALLPVSDTITMAPKMDGCLMIVRTLWTPLKAAKQAKNQLKRIGCKIFGAILNGVTYSRGYYPYYYGYYGYYSYKYSYDDDSYQKFSIRKFGLNFERGIRSHIKSLWYNIPKYAARFAAFTQFSLSRPLLWILLAIISILIAIQVVLESRIEPFQNESIQYIGFNQKDIDQSDSQNIYSDIAAFSRQKQNNPDSDEDLIAKTGLKDSVKLWLFNKQQHTIEGILSFYHSSFKFPGGGIQQWQNQIQSNQQLNGTSRQSLLLKNIKEIKHGTDYLEIEITVQESGVSNTRERTIRMIWRQSEKGWKIIREQQIREETY